MMAKKRQHSDVTEIILEAVTAALERGEKIKCFSDYPLRERIENGWQCPECMQSETEIRGRAFRCCVCGHEWGWNRVRPLN